MVKQRTAVEVKRLKKVEVHYSTCCKGAAEYRSQAYTVRFYTFLISRKSGSTFLWTVVFGAKLAF